MLICFSEGLLRKGHFSYVFFFFQNRQMIFIYFKEVVLRTKEALFKKIMCIKRVYESFSKIVTFVENWYTNLFVEIEQYRTHREIFLLQEVAVF